MEESVFMDQTDTEVEISITKSVTHFKRERSGTQISFKELNGNIPPREGKFRRSLTSSQRDGNRKAIVKRRSHSMMSSSSAARTLKNRLPSFHGDSSTLDESNNNNRRTNSIIETVSQG